jgi:hypothetical protein
LHYENNFVDPVDTVIEVRYSYESLTFPRISVRDILPLANRTVFQDDFETIGRRFYGFSVEVGSQVSAYASLQIAGVRSKTNEDLAGVYLALAPAFPGRSCNSIFCEVNFPIQGVIPQNGFTFTCNVTITQGGIYNALVIYDRVEDSDVTILSGLLPGSFATGLVPSTLLVGLIALLAMIFA